MVSESEQKGKFKITLCLLPGKKLGKQNPRRLMVFDQHQPETKLKAELDLPAPSGTKLKFGSPREI